jgi:hypothetical protein
MTFDDFFEEFDILEICHLSPDTFEEELTVQSLSDDRRSSIIKTRRTSIRLSILADHLPVQRKTWSCLSFEGQWTTNVSSGGRCTSSCNHGCNYWINPQYEIVITTDNNVIECAIVVSLMQKYNRLKPTENPIDRYDYIQVG